MPKTDKKRKKNLKDVSVDEFLQSELLASDDSDAGDAKTAAANEKKKSKTPRTKKVAAKKPADEDDSSSDDEQEEDGEEDDGDAYEDAKKHKQDLVDLQKNDPEFFAYLNENDKALLDFEASDTDDDDAKGAHVPSATLEEASEASSSDDDEGGEQAVPSGSGVTVTLAQVNSWTRELQSTELKPLVLHEIIEAFQSAVAQVEGKAQSKDANFQVVGSAMFNSVIRMCIVNMPKALNNHLQLPKAKADEIVSVTSCKKWGKLQMHVKKYLTAVLQVMLAVAEPDIVSVLLKHVYQMVPYISASQKLVKGFIKKLVMFWSSGEETVRVLAFLSIIKITRNMRQDVHAYVLKGMYISYVRNCKFTSPSTWPLINFMRRSLIEVFALNDVQAYQYGFVYIRQLAIHLRNAVTLANSKDCIRAVYNWQYVHCINFWAQLISALPNSEVLSPLIYPLVQITIGTIKLVPTEKNYPLRFHCLRSLTILSKSTGTFIPVLPFLTEVFAMTDFNKKSIRPSWKPLNFMCMLKLSKSELTEQGFKDGVMSQLFELFFDYLNVESHRIGFPELVLPTSLQLRAFLKTCSIANFCKQIRQILEKIDENSKFITNKRKSVTINLGDTKAIEAWETQCLLEGTPISRYYVNFRKIKDLEMQRGQINKDQFGDDRVPLVNRQALMAKHKAKDRLDYTDLFTHENGDDNDSDTDFFSTKLAQAKGDDDDDDAPAKGAKAKDAKAKGAKAKDAMTVDDSD